MTAAEPASVLVEAQITRLIADLLARQGFCAEDVSIALIVATSHVVTQVEEGSPGFAEMIQEARADEDAAAQALGEVVAALIQLDGALRGGAVS